MSDASGTRASLLLRIRDATDQNAWRDFAALYAPLVQRFGRRAGLQDADAHDLTQQVLQAVSTAIHRLEYDPTKGSFRGWLYGVARRQLYKLREREGRQPRGSGDTDANLRLNELPAPDADDSDWWEAEYKKQRFLWATERVRGDFQPASWQAFWLTAVEGQSAAAVASMLGISVGAVYTAKSRVLDRIKQEIAALLDT
ncbi:MAG: RNA polymerase sigma factor [Planctomycetes bacterium]|nr:RNA polymerase sigma factor [Planctomycetota bacterium]